MVWREWFGGNGWALPPSTPHPPPPTPARTGAEAEHFGKLWRAVEVHRGRLEPSVVRVARVVHIAVVDLRRGGMERCAVGDRGGWVCHTGLEEGAVVHVAVVNLKGDAGRSGDGRLEFG